MWKRWCISYYKNLFGSEKLMVYLKHVYVIFNFNFSKKVIGQKVFYSLTRYIYWTSNLIRTYIINKMCCKKVSIYIHSKISYTRKKEKKNRVFSRIKKTNQIDNKIINSFINDSWMIQRRWQRSTLYTVIFL